MMGMDKRYYLFDLDGTLTDPEEGITKCMAYALQSFGIEEDLADLRKFIGPPLRDTLRDDYGFNPQQAEAAVTKYRERFAVKGLYENVPYPGIGELLERLRNEGKTLLVATSKPTVYAQRILDHFDLAKYFSVVAGSELDGRRSKKGEVIAYALEQAGIPAADSSRMAVMVGDRLYDVLGAKEHGMDCIGVLYGYGSRQELEEAGAAALAESVEQLGELLLP